MKINKIILISFTSLIGIVLLTITIMSLVLNNKKINLNHYAGVNYESKTHSLEAFSHIRITENCIITVTNQSQYQMTYTVDPAQSTTQPQYRIKNDTLYIKSTQTLNNVNGITIGVKHIESITGKECKLYLDNVKIPELIVNAENAQIIIHNNVNIQTLNLHLDNNTSFNSWNKMMVNQLNIDVKQSKVNFGNFGRCKIIKGSAILNSNLQLPQANEYTIELDESSRLNVY